LGILTQLTLTEWHHCSLYGNSWGWCERCSDTEGRPRWYRPSHSI